jgi:hypothetical protein
MSASRCIVVDRLAAGAIPHQRGLALVGDADRGEIPRGKPGPGDCLAAGRHHRAPQILRIMLDPAGLREVLQNLLLGDAATVQSARNTMAREEVVPWSMARTWLVMRFLRGVAPHPPGSRRRRPP